MQRAGTCQSLKRQIHLIIEFVIVAKFGGHVLRHIASSLFDVVWKVDRQVDDNFSLDTFLKIQYLAVGSY